uniref:Uncharacterized protein n=1 Tax=Alexandrium monilatum TaxID=311494 RepID=A0A7S4PYA0_9DINO
MTPAEEARVSPRRTRCAGEAPGCLLPASSAREPPLGEFMAVPTAVPKAVLLADIRSDQGSMVPSSEAMFPECTNIDLPDLPWDLSTLRVARGGEPDWGLRHQGVSIPGGHTLTPRLWRWKGTAGRER